MSTATATKKPAAKPTPKEPKAAASPDSELRAYIDQVARGERADEPPGEELLGEHTGSYFREKVKLLKARYKAAADQAEGRRLLAEAEAIPEVSVRELVGQLVPARLTWGRLVSTLQYLMDPHGGPHPDAMRRRQLTEEGRWLMNTATNLLRRTRDPAIETEVRRGQQEIAALRSAMKDREPLLNLPAAIADVQRKVDRLRAGDVTRAEASQLQEEYDTNAARRLLAAAKDELRKLMAKRREVPKAERDQAADAAKIETIRARMLAAEERGRDPFAGMDWTD